MRVPIPVADLFQYPDPQSARWGLGTKLFSIPTSNMEAILGQYAAINPVAKATPVQNLEHPLYSQQIREWEKFWTVYEGGERFITGYLERFSKRENPLDFDQRRNITPIPAFASSAIDEIKNSIFQRIGDTVRVGGSESYQKAVNGESGGVNLHGATMSWFIGHTILPRLLVQKKIGVYVDAPSFGNTKAQKGNKHPYFYSYRAEDIKTWSYATSDTTTEFSAVLLREFTYTTDPGMNLPIGETTRYRHVYINPDSGKVCIQFYDNDGGMLGSTVELQLTEIPFIVFELTESLMKNVAGHQIALLNMESSDVAYALKSNYPFYVEQFDSKNINANARSAQSAYQDYFNGLYPAGAATVAGITGLAPGSPVVTPATEGSIQVVGSTGAVIPPPAGENADLGGTQGRRYPMGLDRPGFIAPSPDPLRVSMEKQRALKDDIRSLVHLALSSVQSKAVSAESKLVDREQGLESGLAAIGLELEYGERQLARYWANYEGTTPATVNYPEHWSIKSIVEVEKEINGLLNIRETIPSLTLKKEINKSIVDTLLGTRISPETLAKIQQEIDAALGGSSDPKVIASDINVGILGPETGSSLRGYPEGEVEEANQHRAERLALIAQAQSTGKALQTVAGKEAQGEDASLENPASRGIPDASPDPALEANLEKQGKAGRGES